MDNSTQKKRRKNEKGEPLAKLSAKQLLCSAAKSLAVEDTYARKDGFFGIVTNVRSMTPPEIIAAYKNLWVVEDAFGEIKGNLRARPIFHWSDERIVGHRIS